MFKKVIIIISSTVFVILLALYMAFLTILPKILNSESFQNKVKNLILSKSGFSIYFDNLHFKTFKNLNLSVTSDKFQVSNNSNKFLELDKFKINFNILIKSSLKLNADYLFFDKTKLKKSEKKSDFNLRNLPEINVKTSDIILFDTKNNSLRAKGCDLVVANFNGNKQLSFNLALKSNFIKDEVIINNAKIIINKNDINLEKFNILLNGSVLNVKGSLGRKKGYDFNILANNLSIDMVEKLFLYFIKTKEPNNKNFIENFSNFKGTLDINLNIKNKSLSGNVILNKFGANYNIFNIPLYFDKAVFNFDKDKITLNENGYAAYEEAKTDFEASRIFDKDKVIKGNLYATVSNKLAKKSIPSCTIFGKIPLTISYHIKNKEITVDYNAKLPKGTYAIYKDNQIKPKDKIGQIYLQTFKQGNILYLKKYDYSFLDNGIVNILGGYGEFLRENNKYHLKELICKTSQKTPVAFIAFLQKYVKSGFFEGNLRYDGIKDIVTGSFNVYDTKYKNYFVKSAKINADEKTMKIEAEGKFESQPFKCFIDLQNRSDESIIINDLNLYLKKYVIRRDKSKPASKYNKNDIKKTVKDANLTIKNGTIKLDTLQIKNIILENLVLTGFIQDSIAYFSMPDIKFAKGLLKAEGLYDLEYHSSAIDFEAKSIDSNSASDMIFNLKNQFEGLANASMNVRTYDGISYLDADAKFSIDNGALTKIGSMEFIVKKSNKNNDDVKLKLSDIINIKTKKMEALKSDLHGNFTLHNELVKNAELYTKHRFLSLYAVGDYNSLNQNANLNVLGRYNKNAQKGIKVFYIPLSWITKYVFRNSEARNLYEDKIKKIPQVEAKENEQELFSVKIFGNINNSSKLNVDLKSLK